MSNPPSSEVDESTTMPAIFVGHGNPMNAIDSNPWTDTWAEFGRAVPRPRAILSISAHWYINAVAVTAMEQPRTIHDFFGFPQPLFDMQYPAPGLPGLVEEVAEAAKPTWVGADADSWGLDHGTWSVLTHMFPDADVPVVQLSIDATKSFEEHLALGAALAPLRDQGVLIVGSGNVVHNLGMVDFGRPDFGFDWAHEYDENATAIMSGRPGDMASIVEAPHHRLAVPTPDHFIPVLYIAGLAAAAGKGTTPANFDRTLGSLSMTSHVLAA